MGKLPSRAGVYLIALPGFCRDGRPRQYVGSSVNMRERQTAHLRLLRLQRHSNPILQSLHDTHGADSFSFLTLLICARADLAFYEERAIAKFGSCNIAIDPLAPTRGRKLSEEHRAKIAHTSMGRRHSEETKRKLSEARKGKPLPPQVYEAAMRTIKGRRLSPEHREKCRLASTGYRHSSEARRKMSEIAKGRPKSPEHRQKLSAALKGKPWSEARRKAQLSLRQDDSSESEG